MLILLITSTFCKKYFSFGGFYLQQNEILRVSPGKWELDYTCTVYFHNNYQFPYTIFLVLPVTINFRQIIHEVRCNHPAFETTDFYGNSWLAIDAQVNQKKFIFHCCTIFQSLQVFYDEHAFSENCAEWEIPPSRFLQSEKGIELESPAVQALAKKITASKPLEIVKQAFDLVKKTIKYKLQPNEFGAEYAALKHEGDCTEFSSLFVALLRIHKIGARLIIGIIIEETKVSDILHAIAEIFLDGLWIPVDITNLNTFFLGVPFDFISLIRNNFIMQRSDTQIASLYYQCNSEEKNHKNWRQAPRINFQHNLKRVKVHKKVRILEDDCSYFLTKIPAPDIWDVSYHRSLTSYKIICTNHFSNKISVKILIILNRRIVVKIFTVFVNAESSNSLTISNSFFKQFIEKSNFIQVVATIEDFITKEIFSIIN